MSNAPVARRFQHPLHRAHAEALVMDHEPRSLDGGTDGPDDQDPPVARRSMGLSECRTAVNRLAQGDPGGWQHLLRVIEDINQVCDAEGHTLVHLLVLRGLGHAVRQAVDAGADPSRPNHAGVTPWALNEGRPQQNGYENTRDALRDGTIEHQRRVLRTVLLTVGPDGASPEPARRRL